MGKITNAKIKRRQSAPPPDTFSAHRPDPRADGLVSASRAHREAHEAAHPGLVLEDVEATNLRTLSMGRKPHGDGDQSPYTPDGFVGGTIGQAAD